MRLTAKLTRRAGAQRRRGRVQRVLGRVPLVCSHNIALRATRPCVVGDTPSVTPPGWFLVM